jgi:hypothetical protein
LEGEPGLAVAKAIQSLAGAHSIVAANAAAPEHCIARRDKRRSGAEFGLTGAKTSTLLGTKHLSGHYRDSDEQRDDEAKTKETHGTSSRNQILHDQVCVHTEHNRSRRQCYPTGLAVHESYGRLANAAGRAAGEHIVRTPATTVQR